MSRSLSTLAITRSSLDVRMLRASAFRLLQSSKTPLTQWPSARRHPVVQQQRHLSQSLASLRLSGASSSAIFNNQSRALRRTTSIRSRAVSSEASEVEMKRATSGPDLKLAALREKMKSAGVDAFMVPSQDPHFSEYVPTCFERRMFISGFTGSAGTALITNDAALLWTDGRYFLQAEQELGPEWTLMRGGQPGVPEPKAWITGKERDESRHDTGVRRQRIHSLPGRAGHLFLNLRMIFTRIKEDEGRRRI